MGTCILMQADSTGGTQSGLAAIDIPMNGAIVGVLFNHTADLDADLEESFWQLSFGTTFSDANDSRQLIAGSALHISAAGTPANVVQSAANHFIPLNLAVSMGERIYLHHDSGASINTSCLAFVYFDFDLDRPLARRR